MRGKERGKLKNAVLSRHRKRASLKVPSSTRLRAQILRLRLNLISAGKTLRGGEQE
ncbi:hypothetical protein J2Y03_005565 [Neobacillus niacini]|nr:hypothetical protein [Neobacillus niacini]